MNLEFATAGNQGDKVRSDCWARLELTESGGITINLKSKVDVLYGESIRQTMEDMMRFFEIENARLDVQDAGAVPFVLMARIETAIRRMGADKGKRYLPEWAYEVPESARDRFRRSRLYLPGDQPKLAINAAIHKGDGLILDLEDSVSPANKDAARILVRNALRSIDFMGAERQVRINQLPMGLVDLEEIIPQKPHLILIPKVESPQQIQEVDKKIDEILANNPGTPDVYYMPILESAKGILEAYAIAGASKRIVALAIGLEDYTADLGTRRTNEGKESFFARSMLVNAARAAGIQAIDTVFSDVADMDALRESVLEAKCLGFDGKGCIHPRQIPVIHEAFRPEDKEIEKARKIVLAFEEAEKKGLGVVSLGSKMIDPPVVKRALKTIDLAEKEGIIGKDWRNDNE
ncbi:MAG: HpcH/HpaI aldolase/citrate lyase family protein [bacterium]|nr:HpcH/HpaI aldolase/citrate lyase family protein [bacterium]